MMNLIYTYQPLFDYFLLAVGFAYSQQMVLRAGVFSIGSAGFACIGAYAVGILVKNQGWNPLLALAVGTAIGCLGGLLLSIPLARLRGVFQAIATLAFVQIVVSLCLYFEEVTGGPQGFNNIPKLVGTEHLVLAVAVTIYFMYVISRSSIGRAFDALRQDETVGATLGISIRKYHMIAFILSGALAGFFGGMQSLYTYSIEPEMFGFAFLVAALTYIILGGRGTVTGPIIGAAIMSLLPELARPLADNRQFFQGVLMMVMVAFMPHGVFDGFVLYMRKRRAAERELWPDQPQQRRRRRRVIGPACRLLIQGGAQANRHVEFLQQQRPRLLRRRGQAAPQREAALRDLPRLLEALQIHPVQRVDGQPRHLHQHQPQQQHQGGAGGEGARPQRLHARSTVAEST
jgi:branched-chain amino acid transport system permease protein